MLNSYIMEIKAVDDFFAKYVNDEAVVDFARLSKEDKEEIEEDMQDWETYMYCKEVQERVKPIPIDDSVPIRCSGLSLVEKSIYYAVFDAQSRIKANALRIEESFYSNKENYDPIVADYSKVEIRCRENWDIESDKNEEVRKEDAKLLKAKGNQAFHEGDFEEACKYYSNCIACNVSGVGITAYNNRAQTNMKMNNFSLAIPDLNEVLEADSNNVKALYRRATCRAELKMYHEALKDLNTLLRKEPKSKSARMLREDIEKTMSNLKGKSYRLRENSGRRETFEVDVSQLPAYAEANKECLDYLMEVDRTGCLKSCICSYCTYEDRLSYQNNNSLRIRERAKWKPITFKLLDEMGINFNFFANSSDLVNGSKENVFNVSAASNRAVKNNDQTSEKHVVRKNTVSTLNNAKDTRPSFVQNGRKKLQKGRVQHSEQAVEHLIEDMNLNNNFAAKTNAEKKVTRIDLKQIEPPSVEKVFGHLLNESILTMMMNSICTDFDLSKEWNLMSEYLKEVARLKSFKTFFMLVDKRTRNDVSNVLNLACQLNLENAENLKTFYNS